MRRRSLAAVVAALAVVLAGCAEERPSGEIRVFSAASLTEVFTELGAAFEAGHPDATVTFNFAASSALAEQIDEGGSADVFVSADEPTMAKVIDAGHAADPAVIARNRLAILVERGNPEGVTGLADLARPGLVVVQCAPEVPCGRLAAAALRKAGVTAAPASLEENVKAVASKVTLREADAGIVYATDVVAAGDQAEGVPIPGDPELEAVYLMAITTESANPNGAGAWAQFVQSDEGQQALRRFGFRSP